ncbi:RagB/SusD family nutrient uptake outer membrane protein [Pedobacter nyackensis]|uniref:RagB/SusD family nutrient uptake outer membrane protein n=1 Tax=Pedobacter nyackensis TaxID=475255 RepID=UPI00292DAB09|nr:RagB/SusD family nutrient uptake outer membrane protein [Pedobacter nyackensis]
MKRLNFRKKPLTIALVAAFLIMQFVSCKKFLQVQPRDYMFEQEAFATEKGVESALNGIYQSMANPVLYGSNLTVDITEQFAQYYYAPGRPNIARFKDFVYSLTKPYYAEIWKQAYRSLLGTNNFCDRLKDPSFHVLASDKRDILLGEAYAIRAFLHFDQLRLFGPVYTRFPQQKAIPYVRTASSVAQPILPADQVIDQIMHDLDSALVLLAKDPVRVTGANKITTSGVGQAIDYMSNRHRRFNYYAVKTLAARVLLYAGKKAEAWQVATSIIQEQEAFFPWLTEPEFANDPLMSKESFFGIENKKMYEIYRDLFSPLLRDDIIYALKPARLNGLYSPTSTDLRLKYWFKVGIEGEKTYKVLIKHSNATIKDAGLSGYQPLIRKSELYLIAAETAPDLQQGFTYLNTQRINRGLPAIVYHTGSTATELLTAIRDEYQREFVGEGQTFFMFKRLNLATITPVTGSGSVAMNDLKYVVPLPEDESFYR